MIVEIFHKKDYQLIQKFYIVNFSFKKPTKTPKQKNRLTFKDWI